MLFFALGSRVEYWDELLTSGGVIVSIGWSVRGAVSDWAQFMEQATGGGFGEDSGSFSKIT